MGQGRSASEPTHPDPGDGQGRSASEPSHPDPGDGSGEVRDGQSLSRLTQTLGTGQRKSEGVRGSQRTTQ